MSRLVHIVDDDEAVRESLGFLLETAGLEVRTYDSGVSFLEAGAGSDGGCVVTDVRMPGMTGMELVASLRERGSRLPVIVMTGHGDVPLAVEAMKAGVHDFIEKPFDDQAMIRSIEGALQRAEQVQGQSEERSHIARRLGSLSGRERQVLVGLVDGKANKVIARDLGISPRTIEIYRANVMTKMGASSLSELVRMAILVG